MDFRYATLAETALTTISKLPSNPTLWWIGGLLNVFSHCHKRVCVCIIPFSRPPVLPLFRLSVRSLFRLLFIHASCMSWYSGKWYFHPNALFYSCTSFLVDVGGKQFTPTTHFYHPPFSSSPTSIRLTVAVINPPLQPPTYTTPFTFLISEVDGGGKQFTISTTHFNHLSFSSHHPLGWWWR